MLDYTSLIWWHYLSSIWLNVESIARFYYYTQYIKNEP